MVHLPAVADGEMVGKDRIAGEKEAVFPEEAIGRAIVEILDEIVIVLGMTRDQHGEIARRFDPFKIVAAVTAGEPREKWQGQGTRAREEARGAQHGTRMALDLGDAHPRNARE